jgi:putative phosphoribosyl transferase
MLPWVDRDTKLFNDRHHGGRELAKLLAKYAEEEPIVLALPRGGVVVGYEVAKALRAPLEVFIVRKIAPPYNKEFGIGAIGEEGPPLLDSRVIDLIGLSKETLETIIKEEQKELKRRIKVYRNNKPLSDVRNKIVIIVDDGLATGVTAKVAIQAVKKREPKKIIFASPVCAYETVQDLLLQVDDVSSITTPFALRAIGEWYQHFDQITDEEVIDLLKRSKR